MTLPFRALALDIDGTLIDSAKRIMPFTRSEIARVAALGVHVFLVTARSPESTAVVEERLGVPSSHACFGGALVQVRDGVGVDAGDGAGGLRDLLAEPIPAEVVRRVLDAARGLDLHVGVYTRDRWLIADLDYYGLREARNTAVWPVVADLDGIAWEGDDRAFKVMMRGDADAVAKAHEAVSAPELRDRVYAHSNGRILEISSRTAVKWPAVELLCRHHGIRPDEVVAFGDTAADLEMLGRVGFGVLMANASPSLDVPPGVHRTLSNDEDGIGVMLRKCFPTGEAFRP